MEINNGTRSIWIVDDMPDSDRIAIELPERRIGLNRLEVKQMRDELNRLLRCSLKPLDRAISALQEFRWRQGEKIEGE